MLCDRIVSWFYYESHQVVGVSSWCLASTVYSWITCSASRDIDVRYDSCRPSLPTQNQTNTSQRNITTGKCADLSRACAQSVSSIENNQSVVSLLLIVRSALYSHLNVLCHLVFIYCIALTCQLGGLCEMLVLWLKCFVTDCLSSWLVTEVSGQLSISRLAEDFRKQCLGVQLDRYVSFLAIFHAFYQCELLWLLFLQHH